MIITMFIQGNLFNTLRAVTVAAGAEILWEGKKNRLQG